jgi:leucyl-tRNA synthetase
MGHARSVFESRMPEPDTAYVSAETFDLVIQINSRIRARETVDASLDADAMRKLALENERIRELIGDATPKKVIVVPRKLVNILL